MLLYLTADFFFAPDRTFWICLQPHIKAITQSDLDSFITGIGKSSNFQYKLWERTSDPQGLVPVPFPSDANLYLNLIGAASGFTQRRNLRTTAVTIDSAGWQVFQRANQDEDELLRPSNSSAGSYSIAPGAFAQSYNSSLQATWTSLLSEAQQEVSDKRTRTIDPLSHMSQMLAAAFWGGTRRRLPAAANATGMNNISIMSLSEVVPSDGSGFLGIVTNLHSLAGLMFRIGSQDDSASLNNVIDLQLDIDSGSGPNTVMKFSDLPWAKPTVVAFFSSIGTTPPPPNQSSVWFPDLGKRVYVSDGASSFAPQSIGGKLWFRRKQDTGTAEHPGSANIRSLEVRLKTDKVPAATTLDLFLYDSFDVVFTKFGDARQGSHGVLLQLQPRTDERLTFFKEIRSQLAANPDWFTGANKPRFFDRNGTELHPAFVGAYSLPWTGRFFQDDTWALGTILYYGPPMDFPDALMLFPRPGTQTLKLMGSDPSVDPFGLRYELNLLGGTGNFSFDTLAPALSSDDEANFTVTTTFAGQYHFDLAQSISNIEGNLEVQYPAPVDPQNADSIDARQEYLHDLLNYNSVNVLARYFGKTDLRHLNPKTELFPVWTVKPSEQTTEAKDHYSSYFHFRYTLPITPATVTDQKSSAAFFKDLYSRLGEAVKLSFNIEHTYGTIIPLSSQGDATAFVNYAPILPNDLTLDGSIAKGFAPIDQRFCHIALVQGANTDHLMLTFNPKWLSPAWAADEALRPFHVAAWRSVAELAYAQKVVITGKFLRFNFATALDDTTDDVFAQGLESVAYFANWQVDITALLTSAMYTSLANGELQTSTFDNIPLSVGTGVRVASSCTVVEFDLNLTRKPTVLPRASDSVMFVRPSLPLKIGPTGQSMEVVSSAQVNSAYEAWVNTLAQRTSPIQPSLNQQDQELARDLRNILGAGEAESGAWTPLLSSISQTGQVIPAICPLAFRPIATDAQLGDGTYLTVSNYLWALDCIFRAAVFESATMDVVAWQSYFKNLQVKSREIVNILTNMQKMLLPVPNTAASELDAEVKSAATELSQSNTAEFAATMQWLQMQIGAAPSIFGDSKAFLYTRLKGNGAGGLMPIDFVRLNFTKSLMRQETGIGKQSGMGTQQSTDADRALVWESLRDLKSRPSFGFIETLDALRYGDEFQIADFSLSSLRGLVATVRVPAPGQAEPDQIALMGGKVHIPIGSVVPNTPQSKIKLPSRQPVIMPTHHFTGQIIFPEGMNFASLPANPLVRDSLLSGKIEPLPTNPKPDPSIPIACIVGLPPKDMTIEHAPASADQYVLSSIFSIRGDEQMIADWFDAFENDRFHINIRQLASAAVSSTGQVNDFIKSLTATIRPDTIPNLQTGVLSDDSIRLFTAALQPATPPGNIADIVKQPYLQIVPNGTGVTLAFIDSDGRPSKDFEAYLFKTAVASAGCKAPPTGSSMILAINRLATPWTASWTCIQQTRNLLDGSKQAHFANDFATAAPLAGPQMGIQPNVTKTMGPHTPPKILSRKLYTTAELVTQLLIPDLLIPTITGNQWRNFDLSVTFHARQQLIHWTTYVDDQGNIQRQNFDDPKAIQDFSSLPERQFTSHAKSPNHEFDLPRDWMNDPQINDYFVDFHWYSDSNMPFFSINNLPVSAH